MRSFLLPFVLFLAACGSEVTIDGESGASSGAGGSGGSASSSNATSTGSASACLGNSFPCAAGCGGDWFPEEAECIGNEWVCPPGTVNPDDCPSGTCWGMPFSCEVCDQGWQCKPTPACAGGCPGLLCLECPDEPFTIDGCDCSCADSGEFSCVPAAQKCCDALADCGDGFAACVNGVCKAKPPNPDGCWDIDECPLGTACEGAFVCPCNADCDQPDKPGVCAGGPP
jgi:hypothetical protein